MVLVGDESHGGDCVLRQLNCGGNKFENNNNPARYVAVTQHATVTDIEG